MCRLVKAALTTFVLQIAAILPVMTNSMAIAQVGEQPTNQFTYYFYGGEDDWVTQGIESLTTQNEGVLTVAVQDHDNSVFVNLTRPEFSQGYETYFEGLNGALVEPGRYTGAIRYPFNGDLPGLAFYGEARGCNRVNGWFHVLEIETDGKNMQTLAVNFRQNCEDIYEWWSCGQIRFNSDVPIIERALFINSFEEPARQCNF